MAFVNSYKFKEAGLYYDKNGCYDSGIKGSRIYRDYWNREYHRCINGYTVDGVTITGRYYFYLNYCPILRVEKSKKGNVGKRERYSPKFWDEDYKYFWACEIARNGVPIPDDIDVDNSTEDEIYQIRLKEYERLCQPFDLGIVKSPENFAGGKHMVWVKGRGVGASFKGGSIAAYNYFFVEESNTFLTADDKAFLDDDGLWTKTIEYVDFLNANTAFAKGSDFVNDRRNMHIRASYKACASCPEEGYKSDIIGVTLKNNIENARGKRGDILFEEAGKFPKLDTAWNIARKSVEEDGIVFGLMIAFGTSGVEKSNFESLEKMFYEPETFNCLKFYNIWDENRINNQCCFFTPAYMSVTFMDNDGNTDQIRAKEFFDKERQKKLKSSDPTQIDREKTEKPYSPSEAFLNVENNIFPAAELKQWIDEIKTSYLKNFGVVGFFEENEGDVKFKPNVDLKPVLEFPLKSTTDTTGAIVIYESPYREPDTKIIPNNLYVICVDPYGSETVNNNIKSLGSVYVLKNVNNVSTPDDCIVATYNARPKDMQIFHRNIFYLARYYNAKICYESDRGEALLTYGKTMKLTKWFMEELTLGFNEEIPKAKSHRSFGMHMGSGKNNPRKNFGDGYINEWLRKVISSDEEGNKRYGYHKILDIGLLEELSKYNGVDNYDRISAIRVGMFAMQEISYKFMLKNKRESSKGFHQLLNAELFT